MVKPQSSVSSAKARELALEEYESRHSGKRTASDFYRKLREECAVESDPDAPLEEKREAAPGHGSAIFLDTNVVSETLKPAPDPLVIEWLAAHDAKLMLPTVTIAEIALGIKRIRPEQRAQRLSLYRTGFGEPMSGRRSGQLT